LAHELNQPLATITNYIAMCEIRLRQLGYDDQSLQQSLSEARSQALRAGEVVQSIRNFLRKGHSARATVDVSQSISHLMPIINALVHERDARLEVVQEDDLHIRIDPALFEQMLLNLCKNGLDAMTDTAPESRKFVIFSKRQKKPDRKLWVHVSVQDSGHGIRSEDGDKLFDSFFTTKIEGLGIGFVFVEGNAELTPARLVGHFDPARVLTDGYEPDVFVDGPLVTAMRDGSLLYVEEINRIPEETLNVLITVMSEGELNVPRYGRVAASAGFRLVAAMNPFDAVGTARISGAVYDRVCRVSVGYQNAEVEQRIAGRGTKNLPDGWLDKVVELVRRTRTHSDLRVGSSVRGAIDMAAVTVSLASVRSLTVLDAGVGLDAALVALSGRVRVREGSVRTAEDIITELWNEVFTPVW
jgi:MoxR-like ATPase